MELNRDQIVKALECCSENEDCAHCPCWEKCKCINSLLRDALALIRALTEENEIFASLHKTACEAVKIDTVRKMQEMVNHVFGDAGVTGGLLCQVFDQIAKEMLEEEP